MLRTCGRSSAGTTRFSSAGTVDEANRQDDYSIVSFQKPQVGHCCQPCECYRNQPRDCSPDPPSLDRLIFLVGTGFFVSLAFNVPEFLQASPQLIDFRLELRHAFLHVGWCVRFVGLSYDEFLAKAVYFMLQAHSPRCFLAEIVREIGFLCLQVL